MTSGIDWRLMINNSYYGHYVLKEYKRQHERLSCEDFMEKWYVAIPFLNRVLKYIFCKISVIKAM